MRACVSSPELPAGLESAVVVVGDCSSCLPCHALGAECQGARAPRLSWAVGTMSALAAVVAGASEGACSPTLVAPEPSPRQGWLGPNLGADVCPRSSRWRLAVLPGSLPHLPAPGWVSLGRSRPPWHRLPQVPALHLQLLLLGEQWAPPSRPRRRPGQGPGPVGLSLAVVVHCPQLAGLAVMAVGILDALALKSDYIQPAGLGHLPGHSLHPGGGGRCRHGDRGAGLLCHLQGAEEPAASGQRGWPPCRQVGLPGLPGVVLG